MEANESVSVDFEAEDPELSPWNLFRITFSSLSFGLLTFLTSLSIADSCKRSKLQPSHFCSQIAFFLSSQFCFDAIHVVCTYVLFFTPSTNDSHFQNLAFAIEFGWMNKRSLSIAIGICQLLKIASSSSSFAIYFFERKWRNWLLILLPIGFIWPFSLLFYHISHQHISMRNLVFSQLVPLIARYAHIPCM